MRFIRPLFLLAAWFLWMTPLEAAMSMRLIARRSVASSSSVPTAATAFFVRVRSSDLTALLRSRCDRVLLVALDLALDVGHEASSWIGRDRRAARAGSMLAETPERPA